MAFFASPALELFVFPVLEPLVNNRRIGWYGLRGRLETVVDEAKLVLGRLTAQQLLEVRRIQGFDVTGLAAIFSSVPQFRGHTKETVHMTRLQFSDDYRFAWTPTTPEQGAAS